MNILLLGRGKTGSLVAEVARQRGHRVQVAGSAENAGGAAITAEKTAVMMSEDAARRLARGRSPAPSARETVAEAAMVNPMLSDMTKNVIKPT